MEKIEQIIEQYSTKLLRIAYSQTGNLQDAEDIVQDVFIKYAAQTDFESDEHVKAWLIRVTINMCVNLNKSSRKTKRATLDFDIVQTEEETPDLTDYLMQLPEKYRAVLYLYYFEEWTVNEISETIGKSTSGVYTLLERGRNRLKKIMEQEGFHR